MTTQSETGDTGTVFVFDTHNCNASRSGCTVIGRLNVTAGSPTAVAINTTTGTVYVGTATVEGANGLSVLDGTTCSAASTVGCGQPEQRMTAGPSLGSSPNCGGWFVGVAVNEVTNTVYATNTEGCGGRGKSVYVYNGATCGSTSTSGCGDDLATIDAGLNPMPIAVDQATNTVYAPLLADGEHPGNVAVINGATCNAADTSGCGQAPTLTPAGFAPVTAAVDPTTHHVYVTNVQDTSVSVIDGTHCNATDWSRCNVAADRKLSVDDYPSGAAIAPAVGTAYVTSGVKGTVTVVRLR